MFHNHHKELLIDISSIYTGVGSCRLQFLLCCVLESSEIAVDRYVSRGVSSCNSCIIDFVFFSEFFELFELFRLVLVIFSVI